MTDSDVSAVGRAIFLRGILFSSQVRRPVSNLDHYEQYLRAEVSELITNYGPLLVMWFDVPQEFDAKRGQGLMDLRNDLWHPRRALETNQGAGQHAPG